MPSTETVTVGSDSFSKSWVYDPATTFKTSETIYELETTFTEGGNGNVATVTSPRGKTTSFESYKYGQPRILRTPMYVIARTINPDGTIAYETRSNRTTGFEYDALGRPTLKQPPGDSSATTIDYDDDGRLMTVTRGSSIVTTTLDDFGRPIQTSNNVGIVTKTAYDAEGRMIHEGIPYKPTALAAEGGNDIYTTIEYDALGRVTSRTNPAVPPAQVTASSRTYFGDGSVIVTDEMGRHTQLVTEAFGNPDEARVAYTVDAAQLQWEYAYNALGKLARVLSSDGKQRTWIYNTQGMLETETHPESGTTLFTYVDGLLATRTDSSSVQTSYGYDDNDRLVNIQAGTQQTTFTYEYNSEDRIAASATNPATGVVWKYDPSGLLQYRQDVVDGKTFTTLFEYDNDDNIKALIYPSGRRVQFNYNAAGQPTKVYEVGRDYADAIAFHPSGGLAAYTAGNGLVTTITYDPSRYWIKNLAVGQMDITYGYDFVGNPFAITDSRGPGYGQSFYYDVLDRLTDAAGPYGTPRYEYDLHGNRNNDNYTIDPNTLRLTSDGTQSYTYYNNGNLWTAGNKTFTYTPQNQVATSVHDNVSTTYAYTVDEQRVKKSSNGSTTYYIHGPGGELLTEWKDPGTATGRVRDYIYLGTRLLSAVAKNTPDDPIAYSVPVTASHKWASSWQVPSDNGDSSYLGGGISAAARKSSHPDMPRTGLRLGLGTSGGSLLANGPFFLGNNVGQPKQGGLFFEFEIERFPFLDDAEILGTDGGGNLSSGTDDLRLFVTPGKRLVLKHHGGRTTPQTLWTSPVIAPNTTHTLELRFEYNSASSYPIPNPVWENLTSRAQVLYDGTLSGTYGAGAGGTWDSSESNPQGLDLKNGSSYLVNTKLKSPASTNGLLMNVFRAGLTGAQTHGDALDPYGNAWRTTLLEAAGPGTYSEWTGGQPDWRARSVIAPTGYLNTVTTNVIGQKISYLMEAMPFRGITGNIGVVMVGVRMQSAPSGTKAFIRRNGVETELDDLVLVNNDIRWYRVATSGWLPADVVEIGVICGAASTTALHSVALMVEHNTPEPAPLTDTSARVITVNYTGNGTAQTIDFPGINAMPTVLLVVPTTSGVEPIWWWDSRIAAAPFADSLVTFSRIWPQKGKFQVVHTSTKSYNANGVNYVAIALFDPSGRYVIPFAISKGHSDDDYEHQLRYPQSRELAADFTPDFVFGGAAFNSTGDYAQASYYRGPGHAGDLTGKLGVSHASDADRIQSIGQGTVQFGSLVYNSTGTGDQAFWAGRVNDLVSSTRLMAVTSYVGDGTASRNISLDLGGEAPVFALVVPTHLAAKAYRVTGDTAARGTATGNAYPNSITALGANQITVGTALNAAGKTYDVWVITTGLVTP